MDVLLDSNVYLEDLKMTGNQFAELFAYVRRTGAHLLLPELVREEVVSKYSERLKESARKAQSAHENLWKLATSKAPQFKGPAIKEEIETLLSRMRQPAKGIPVVEIDDYSGADIREVVRRGIQRQRPASDSGEELRDVVLWLIALKLATHSRSGIVFISNDKTFASEDGKSLHPDLQKDISRISKSVDFFVGIREFVVANALDQEPADPKWFLSVVPLEKIEDLIVNTMLQSQTRIGSVVGVDKLKETEFRQGTKYRIKEQSFFVESLFDGSARLTIEEYQNFTSYVVSGGGSWDPFGVGTVQSTPYLTTEGTGHIITYPSIPTWPLVIGSNVPGNLTGVTAGNLNVANTSPSSISYSLRSQPKKYLCSYRISLNARVLDGKLASLEANSLQFNSFFSDE